MTRLFLPIFLQPGFLDRVSGLLEAERAARLKLLLDNDLSPIC